MPNSTDLLDVNVWLALAVEAHTHHRRARGYWENEAAPIATFCRITQLAFLRHLTNRAIMGDQVLTPPEAWEKWLQFRSLPGVQYLEEPPDLDERLAEFCHLGRLSPNFWTDGYLAAFTRCVGLRLVTFDRGFSRFAGLDLLVLNP